MAAELARQWMQPKPWQVHVLGHAATVKHRKNVCQLPDMLWSHSLSTTAIVERPQPPVLER